MKLGNDAVKLDATVLYADLADSTGLVKDFTWWFAAEVYKAYLICSCHIIRQNGGVITAFDGDRVMAVYIGDGRDAAAARTGLQINYAVSNIINPKISSSPQSTPRIVSPTPPGISPSQPPIRHRAHRMATPANARIGAG